VAAVWVPLAKYRWQCRLRRFVEDHVDDFKDHEYDDDVDFEEEEEEEGAAARKGRVGRKKVLFVVNPAAGGGNAMDRYGECRAALAKAARDRRVGVDLVLTRSSRDVLDLSSRQNFASYGAIAVLAGDSTHSELVHATLREHGGRWPDGSHPPLLLLPGGTANVVAVELFGKDATCEEIIRTGLFSESKRGAVIRVTSSASPGEARYAIHTAFDGLQRRMIDAMEYFRPTVYPAFGEPAIMALVLASVVFVVPSRVPPPAILSTFKAESLDNRGFGTTRFSDDMVVLHVVRYPGPFAALALCVQMATGTLARKWRDGTLPDGIRVEVVRKYTAKATGKGDGFTLYCDGSTAIPMRTSGDVTFEVVTDAVPYFVPPETSEKKRAAGDGGEGEGRNGTS